MSPEKPRRLGRGLEALIGSASASPLRSPDTPTAPGTPGNELRRIPLSRIRPNPFQPRRDFAEAELTELRASLSTSGMLQPVVVRQTADGFELISGERRYRAANQLGWEEIPALVREADERTMLTLALIENLQRADLNAVEEARGYQRLSEEFELTHQQISDAVGKERSTVTNLLRLLTLPTDVQRLLEDGKLTMGHARALLAVSDPRAAVALAREIVSTDLSVRQIEKRVRELTSPAQPRIDRAVSSRTQPSNTHASSPALRQSEDLLRRRLQTDVRIHIGVAGKGTVEIAFYSTDDLNRLLELLTSEPRVGD